MPCKNINMSREKKVKDTYPFSVSVLLFDSNNISEAAMSLSRGVVCVVLARQRRDCTSAALLVHPMAPPRCDNRLGPR